MFCGSCAIESKVQGFDRMILNDKHTYLIALLRAVQQGYEPPDVVTEEEYAAIKANKDADPALTGFVGFGCSFGGKFFCCYARSAENTNYAAQSKRSLLKDMATLKNAEILGIQNETGSVEAGKSADMLITGGNPLEDLTCLRAPYMVVMAGRVIAQPQVKKYPLVERELDKFL